MSDSGLMIEIVSQGRSGITRGISSVAHASTLASSATLHALPGASGSRTALTHTGAHYSHVHDVACLSVACVLAK